MTHSPQRAKSCEGPEKFFSRAQGLAYMLTFLQMFSPLYFFLAPAFLMFLHSLPGHYCNWGQACCSLINNGQNDRKGKWQEEALLPVIMVTSNGEKYTGNRTAKVQKRKNLFDTK